MTSWKDKVQLTAQQNRQEIVKAKLNRREMMRLGLLTAGGSLILKQGLSSRAFAGDPDATVFPPSPPVRPWVQHMPQLSVKQPVNSDNMKGGGPDGTLTVSSRTSDIARRQPDGHWLLVVDNPFGGVRA